VSVIKQYLDGLKILEEWFRDDPTVVSNELAQNRCNTCLKCPMNQSGNPVVEAVAKKIKLEMELKLCRELHVEGIESLKTCQACFCWTPSKIWFPIQNILPKQADRRLFWDGCWILSES
jgi:hypothetical protein